MSTFNPLKTCVFSTVKARITKDGKPLVGVKVIRKWEWHKPRQDSTKTDAQGWFTFPAVFESSASRLLPMELVIAQALYVEVDGIETKFWSYSKRDPKENTELGGQKISLLCELTHPIKSTREFGSIMFTLCTW